MKAERSDLKALLKANQPDQSNYRFGQRLNFVVNEASIDDLLKQLSDSALTLRNFVDDNEDLHHIHRSNQESQQARQTKAANSLNKVRRHANALFHAIACGWSHQCHEKHGAMLRLEHRCERGCYSPQASSSGGVTAVRFTLLFSWQNHATQESISWHETTIMPLDEDSSQVLRPAA